MTITAGKIVGFADGFPLLIVSLASIDFLNDKLEQKVCIDRFRPNIVTDGCSAHAENGCSPSPAHAVLSPVSIYNNGGKHPTILKALASCKRSENVIFFGQNGLHNRNGELTTGQTI
jgi:uncharacterized protein